MVRMGRSVLWVGIAPLRDGAARVAYHNTTRAAQRSTYMLQQCDKQGTCVLKPRHCGPAKVAGTMARGEGDKGEKGVHLGHDDQQRGS